MSRASLDQVKEIIAYMEKHSALALGTSKTMEGRYETRGKWQELANILNALKGARKSAKGWAKYWTDKKFNLRKLALARGNTDSAHPPPAFSPLDAKILRMVGFTDGARRTMPNLKFNNKKVKQEVDESDCEEEQLEDYEQMDKPIEFVDHPMESEEDRHSALMDKLFQVMTEQASALTRLAQSSQLQAQALERLAESSQQQACAAERLADSVERIAHAVTTTGSSLASIDCIVKRVYGDS